MPKKEMGWEKRLKEKEEAKQKAEDEARQKKIAELQRVQEAARAAAQARMQQQMSWMMGDSPITPSSSSTGWGPSDYDDPDAWGPYEGGGDDWGPWGKGGGADDWGPYGKGGADGWGPCGKGDGDGADGWGAWCKGDVADGWGPCGKGGLGKDGWGMDGFGMFGKGKGPRPLGPRLVREELTIPELTGEVMEWKGRFGWIRPCTKIDHPLAGKHGGKIFVSSTDLEGCKSLKTGDFCKFRLYADASGLGACHCTSDEDAAWAHFENTVAGDSTSNGTDKAADSAKAKSNATSPAGDSDAWGPDGDAAWSGDGYGKGDSWSCGKGADGWDESWSGGKSFPKGWGKGDAGWPKGGW